MISAKDINATIDSLRNAGILIDPFGVIWTPKFQISVEQKEAISKLVSDHNFYFASTVAEPRKRS